MIYKIRNKDTGLFSNGVIHIPYKTPCVAWNKKGKEWPNETNLRNHLMRWLEKGGSIPEYWEILSVEYSATKPIDEWFDAKMTMKILKSDFK